MFIGFLDSADNITSEINSMYKMVKALEVILKSVVRARRLTSFASSNRDVVVVKDVSHC